MRFLQPITAGVVLCTALLGTTGFAADISPTLADAVASRSEQDRSRDAARHPAATLTFFGIEPGMAVAEALPGGGWYTRILAPYLGGKGAIYSLNYNDSMWPLFGFFDADRIAKRIADNKAFPETVAGITDNGIASAGLTFDQVPESVAGTLDAVLMIRALHNLSRFEAEAGTLSQALQATHDMLKPGGIVGVVQHRAPASSSDEWASGSRGYMKRDTVVAAFEAAGFVLTDSSEINANPADQPGAEDIVWRLPPSLRVADGDEAQKAANLAIGESDRMTLLFTKPERTE